MSDVRTPIDVFCSYAHADEPLLQQLEAHFSVLKRQGLISTWYDRQVVPGTDWARAIDAHLNSASVILLLISSDFLASDYCFGIEAKRALERHQAKEALVIPILLRPVDWKSTPLVHLQALPTNARPITSWSNEDEAFADVTAGIRRAIEDFSLLPMSISHTAFPSIWNIPYRRNPVFTGREEILTRLADALKMGQPAALSQPQAISGLGGIGKTQIAVEYAYRYAQYYQAVLWARSETREELISGFVALADLLHLPLKEEKEQLVIVRAVSEWLRTHEGWLLILDNADDLKLVREFLPYVLEGHILLTTRAQAMGRLASRIEVDTLRHDVGTLFLLRRASLINLDASLENADDSDVVTARAICEELGGLPLALDQAGGYIEETQCSLRDYQRLYRTRGAELLNERGGLVDDHPEPVATSWSLTFQKVEQTDPAAAELLRGCAFLHPDAIPEEIITAGAEHLGPLLHVVALDPMALNKSVAALGAYSLIRRDSTTSTLSMHRLVQAVLRDSMAAEVRKQWAERTVLVVNKSFPEVEFPNWTACERYLPQALACAFWIEQEQIASLEAARLLHQTGNYLTERGHYLEAEPLYQRALTIYKQQLGAEHPVAATSLNNLARLYWRLGKYEQAEPLYKSAIAIREQHLGSEHPDTATSLNNLADMYVHQSKYEQAKPLYQRALAIREQQLGPEHPDTAGSLNNLSWLYREQGRYEKAEHLLKRALAIRERQLGMQHPDTLASFNNLARLYARWGKYEQAEQLLKRALAIREQQLGPEHPSTASNLNSLAELYQMQGKYEQGEQLLKRALAIRELQLGPEHPDTATSLNNLAWLYQMQDKYEQAEQLLKRALAIRERQLGPEHPSTAQSLNNLARLYVRQGKYEQGEQLLKRALAIREQQLGPEHPSTAVSLNSLAEFYQIQGRYEQTEPLYQRALAIREQQLGPEHPDTLVVRKNYASFLRTMGRDNEAVSLEAHREQP